MTRYDIRFLNHARSIYGRDEMLCACDEDVIERARQLHRHGIGKGYEIWDGERLVHTEIHH